MLFNSFEFLLFLPIFFFLYWFVFNKNLKTQNLFLLLSSYVFYGWWDYRFLSLIFLSTIVDYIIGLKIIKQDSKKRQKLFLWFSILFNLSILGFFKYYNFFVDSWIDFLTSLGYEIKSDWTLSLILPVGISFYTFQTMSYTIDVYKKKMLPTNDFISFASFVSFFPQLVAGPIERASNLLPQILRKRHFHYKEGVNGLRLILWGMFKKVVIADSLSPMVDDIFNNHYDLDGGTLWLGAIYFAFQIYCDFSGYSDIAIGISKLLGIELMSNFKFPYFSKNIAEFWRKWHISLSTWFRDYMYIPLGGSKEGKLISVRNIFIIFLTSGFWHGANWTFIFWGFFHSFLFLPTLLFEKKRKDTSISFSKAPLIMYLKELLQIFATFLLITVGWVFFRSNTITDSLDYIYTMFVEISFPSIRLRGILFVSLLIFLDFLIKSNERLDFYMPKKLEIIISITMLLAILFFHNISSGFIYFQF